MAGSTVTCLWQRGMPLMAYHIAVAIGIVNAAMAARQASGECHVKGVVADLAVAFAIMSTIRQKGVHCRMQWKNNCMP
eukprot:5052688-Ditylum_brightwellii.AAC.3